MAAAPDDAEPVRHHHMIGRSWMWWFLAGISAFPVVFDLASGLRQLDALALPALVAVGAFALGCVAWRAERQAMARYAAMQRGCPADGDDGGG